MASADPDLPAILRERGMRVTPQRLLIERALRELGGHQSAEQLHEALQPSLPGVSQQTVYSTLQLLADLGVARRVPVAKGSTRFESRPDEHHHAACGRCGEIIDLEVRVRFADALAAARAAGFEPDYASLTVIGRCARCAGLS